MYVNGFTNIDGFYAIGTERVNGWREQPGLLLSEYLLYSAIVAARPGPLVRYVVTPNASLAVAFGQRREGPAGPEGIANIADGTFDAAFLIPGAHLAKLRREMIVGA